MQNNKIMEININDIKKGEINIDELEIETLKMKLVERKVRKAITKDENGDYILDDSDINYLNDCRNLTFREDFTYEDLALVLRLKELPKENLVKLEDVIKVTLNGITGVKEKDIIIVEPLKSHMDKITRLDILDTRLKEDIYLSDKAIILVKSEDNIDVKPINGYRIIKYTGDIKIILEKILILLGFKPQTILKKAWKNSDNNKVLNNYLNEKYPSKVSIDILETLEERQNKELGIRDELLSIIRKGAVLIFDDIDITPDELVLLAEHYRNIHAASEKDLNKDSFTDFVNIYGVRISKSGIYLLDDESIAAKGYADTKTIDILYNIYLKSKQSYKDRLGFLSNRRSVLKKIYKDDVELDNQRKISSSDLNKLYIAYQKKVKENNSIKQFMQDIGIRVDFENNFYLLSDNQTLNLFNFVSSRDESKIATCLREKFGEECYTEDEKNFGLKINEMNSVNLSFDGLDEYFTK